MYTSIEKIDPFNNIRVELTIYDERVLPLDDLYNAWEDMASVTGLRRYIASLLAAPLKAYDLAIHTAPCVPYSMSCPGPAETIDALYLVSPRLNVQDFLD
jgi:hypothetical protein